MNSSYYNNGWVMALNAHDHCLKSFMNRTVKYIQ